VRLGLIGASAVISYNVMPLPPEYRVHFPGLTDDNHDKSSEIDPNYNCIGHAAGSILWWEPVRALGGNIYWPHTAPLQNTIAAYQKAYQFIGYVDCADGSVEAGYEKIALYIKDGTLKHAARQLADGKWTSKLGRDLDIWHSDPGVLEGQKYGHVQIYMKRKI